MERKLWGLFSGTHLTIMFAAAMAALLPGALYAVDSFSNVAIEDPVTGIKARLTRPGSLDIYDQLASYARQPANFVHILGYPSCGGSFYTVPVGKGLVVQSMTVYSHNTSAPNAVEIDLYGQSNCGGGFVAAVTSDRAHETVPMTFGSGMAFPAGASLSAAGTPDFNGSFHLYGYLVPASVVPPVMLAQMGVQEATHSTMRHR